MNHRIELIAAIAIAVSATLAPGAGAGCARDDEPGAGGADSGGTGGSAGAGGVGLDASTIDAEAGPGPVESCGELGATDCFSNNECAAGTRCENAGTEELEVPCCLPGVRGSGEAGGGCASENDCASAVCVDGLCSATCQSEADCPAGMKRCIPIAFSGSDDDWCMPDT